MKPKTFMSLGEQIFQTLKERIVGNQYPPGTMLQIDKLAEELGVSSTPIRETLFKLDGIGLVKMERNKGAVVSEISERMVRDVWQFRSLLESFIVRETVPHCDKKALEKLREEVAYLLEIPPHFELYQKADQHLHDMLYQNMKNTLVKDALKNLLDHSRRIRYFAESSSLKEEVVREVSLEHLAIVDALLAEDTAAVEEAIRRHLKNGEERTIKALPESGRG